MAARIGHSQIIFSWRDMNIRSRADSGQRGKCSHVIETGRKRDVVGSRCAATLVLNDKGVEFSYQISL
jgi:hypothetical protein